MSGRSSDRRQLASRVEQLLLRCLEWTQHGRHRKVLGEVERLLPQTADEPRLEAQLLVWKAQALLTMGLCDRALTAAERSWDLEASPHACHLLANALNAVGEPDEAEELMRLGWRLFPEALHLPLQLAMTLADQGRVPEALDVLEELPDEPEAGDDLQVFLLGLRANLLAVSGRWGEAEALLGEGLRRHPESTLLHETRGTVGSARRRASARERLAQRWEAGLEPLEGAAAEVDDAAESVAAAMELPRLRALAARRLWRAFLAARPVQPQAVGAWAAALLAAVAELDGETVVAAEYAPAADAVPTTIRSALGRIRTFLRQQEPEFARRWFAALDNPQLDDDGPDRVEGPGNQTTVVAFPDRPARGDT